MFSLGQSRIPLGNGKWENAVGGGGRVRGLDLQHVGFSTKTYANTKELGPVEGEL